MIGLGVDPIVDIGTVNSDEDDPIAALNCDFVVRDGGNVVQRYNSPLFRFVSTALRADSDNSPRSLLVSTPSRADSLRSSALRPVCGARPN